ncbi:MAG: helix-turn-helix transcriptional regulator [Alphaproteobacteria bacterium]|nr:helix-turn-helix transcriptional regulator [Alphaproteobacteria bacterium]
MTALTLTMAEIGALLGDPARANMLAALMDGRALTATELAYAAGVTPQTTSGHLAKLTAANLLALHKQGRNRYYRLASPMIGSMLESVMTVAAVQMPARRGRSSQLDERMRTARSCYDHIAGRLGVSIADTLIARQYVVLGEDGGEVTDAGAAFLAHFGADATQGHRSRRAFCRPCLDWSERRWHIAGAVGAALLSRCLELGWLARERDTRALAITDNGRHGFADTFGLRLADVEHANR